MRNVLAIVEAGTIARYNGVLVVEDAAWRMAIAKLHALPCSGRHVWKASDSLWHAIRSAVNFNQGESK